MKCSSIMAHKIKGYLVKIKKYIYKLQKYEHLFIFKSSHVSGNTPCVYDNIIHSMTALKSVT